MRIFRKNQRSNSLSPPHQTERCAFRALRARNSILKSTHFVLPEHKTVSPHHPRRAFCALRAQNSAPHTLPRRISRPAGAKQPTAPKRRRLCRRARRQTGVADFRVRRRKIILTVNRRDMRVAIYTSRSARVAAALWAARHEAECNPSLKRKGTALPFPFVLEFI